MSIFDVFRRRGSAPDSFEDFYRILAHGTDAEIASLVYRRDLLSEGEVKDCVTAVTFHCRAPSSDSYLTEKDRLLSSNGSFALLIVLASWIPDDEDNFVPLIVTAKSPEPKIAGIVLPFDGLMTKQLGKAASQIGELSAAWVLRKIKAAQVAESDKPLGHG